MSKIKIDAPRRPTLDQVIRDAVSVQARFKKEGMQLRFHIEFSPVPLPDTKTTSAHLAKRKVKP